MTEHCKLIDPTASVIDRTSSTRAIRLVYRALLSHISKLEAERSKSSRSIFEDEPLEIELNSSRQLASDIDFFVKDRENA